MPTYEEARSIVLESVAPAGTERVETGRALDRTLAEDVAAPWPLPFCKTFFAAGEKVDVFLLGETLR